jgi:DNA-binding helix-hairpin-helix protein with protein kinase domain
VAISLFTSKGALVSLGHQLGKGGEGSVFDVPSLQEQVAKVYHEALDPLKQAKLSFMASSSDAQLLSFISWPKETLHRHTGGPVVGFLMHKVSGWAPIHAVYSPAHRRKEKPKAAWDFLLAVARNTAAAFESVHIHKHVIGDVNQDSLFVANDSKVILIDSDSFQVNANGKLYPCKVGVAMFTPPELQGISSFKSVVRTPNHDNFGLALLIFQLLFGGRHPFSGVPLKNGVGDALEEDIKALRYAYGPDAAVRGISPPPRSIPLTLVPPLMQAMFHSAFTEKGSIGGRPTASQWLSSLDSLRGSVRKCTASVMHVVPGHLPKCPWCELEQQGIVYFVDTGTTYAAPASGFVLLKVWAIIEAVPAPSAAVIPNIESISTQPLPLPEEVARSGASVHTRRIWVVLISIGVMMVVPKFWFLWLLGGLVGWFMANSSASKVRNEEREKRSGAYAVAKSQFEMLVRSVKSECDPEPFKQLRKNLQSLRDEYEALDNQEKAELNKLHVTAQDRQKAKFLEGFFIDKANISGVGVARKAALRSFGIETAADVSYSSVSCVRGFGQSLTSAVVDWRAGIERRFVFNPLRAVTEQEKNAVRAKFGSRRTVIENVLTRAPAELRSRSQAVVAKNASLQPQLAKAALQVAQTKADLSLL